MDGHGLAALSARLRLVVSACGRRDPVTTLAVLTWPDVVLGSIIAICITVAFIAWGVTS